MVKEQEIYEYRHDILTIRDEELQLHFSKTLPLPKVPLNLTTLSPQEDAWRLVIQKDSSDAPQCAYYDQNGRFHGEYKTFYPSGQVKSSIFYCNGQLYGPSIFYSSDGTIVAYSWFIEGKKHGKCWQYYTNGKLYSLQRFIHGLRCGKQEYFYENGQRKTLMLFDQDHQIGTTRLYYPNGQLKREIEFDKGQKMGYDRFWNSKGILIEESFYRGYIKENHYRRWHSNGQKALEYFFHIPPNLYDETAWDQQGNILNKGVYNPQNQSYTRYLYNKKGEVSAQINGKWNGKEIVFE